MFIRYDIKCVCPKSNKEKYGNWDGCVIFENDGHSYLSLEAGMHGHSAAQWLITALG